MHALFRELIGQIAPRPYHVVVNGWYFYSINFISGGAFAPQPAGHAGARSSARRATSPGSFRRPFATLIRSSSECGARTCSRATEPSVADAEGRVETLPVAELPALIDELAELAGEYFVSIAALSGAGYKLEMNLAQFYRRHLARSLGGSHLPLLAGFEPAAARRGHAIASLDWWHAPLPLEATATPADDSRPRGRGEAGGRGSCVRGACLVAAPASRVPPPAGRCAAHRPDSGGADRRADDRVAGHATGGSPHRRGAGCPRGDRRADDVFFLTRAEALAALDGAAPAADRRRAGSAVAPGRAGPPGAAAARGAGQPDDPASVGQLPGAHRCRSIGHGARVGRAGVAGARHRARFA